MSIVLLGFNRVRHVRVFSASANSNLIEMYTMTCFILLEKKGEWETQLL